MYTQLVIAKSTESSSGFWLRVLDVQMKSPSTSAVSHLAQAQRTQLWDKSVHPKWDING